MGGEMSRYVAFDADTVAVAELADIVGTLVADLQALQLIG